MTRQHIEHIAGVLLAVGLVIACVQLGRWQLQRMDEKQALLDARDQAMAHEPLDLGTALARAGSVQRVEDCGQWHPAVLVLDSQQQARRPGHRSYQLWRASSGQGLLVELGWRPWSGERALPDASPLEGQACLSGLLLPAPSAGLALAGPALQALPGGGWLIDRLSPEVLAAVPGLPALADARVLRPDPALSLGYQRDGELLPNTLPPQRHLGYAVQWFALAAAVAIGALLLGWRSRRQPHPASSPRTTGTPHERKP